MVTLLRSMQAEGYAHPVVVLANTPEAGGLAKAESLGVATEVVDHRTYGTDRAAFEAEIQNRLNPYKIDMICLAGFMRVLTPDFTEQWEGKMLNIHPSLLPKYKGLHTHKRAIEAGDTVAGCSVHLVTAKLDDGPVLGQAEVPVYGHDTEQSLAARVLEQEHILYPMVLKRFVCGMTELIKITAD